MAYSWARRNELAETRLEMMGVPRQEGISASSQERKMGLSNPEGRADYVRQHDWFYRGTVGTHGDVKGPYDTPQMARNYVKGFLYKGHQTPSRKEARDQFKGAVDVDWQLWRDYRLGYGRKGQAGVQLPGEHLRDTDELITDEEEDMEGEEEE